MPGEGAFDLAVIGGGSAGVRTARVAASLGARVVLFEASAIGGTCVNLGCIPKKMLAYGAHFAHELSDARGMGWSVGEVSHSWPDLVARKDAQITRLNAAYEKLLVDAGVEIVRARARLTRESGVLTVHADERRLRARHVIIATGGAPRRPAIPGAELGDVSDDFFHWPSLPRSVAIVGAGYVALEIASMLAALGVEVDLIARARVLSGFDPDLGEFVAGEIRKHGVRVHDHRGDVAAIEREGEGLVVVDGGGARVVAERVLFAIGRVARVHGFGLEELGVAVARDAIVTDDRFATNVAGVYAIGDVIGRVELTPVALAEGQLLARTLFGKGGARIDYDLVPSAVFSMPPVASVGLTEPTARARGLNVRVYRTNFRPLKHTLTGSNARSLVKLVVDAESDRVLGVHMVGDDAPEIIQGFAVALMAGATKAHLDATIGVHPTAAEEFVTMRTPIT